MYCAFETDAALRHAVTTQLTAIGFRDTLFFDADGLQAFLTVDPVKRLGVLVYRGTQADELQDLLANANAFLKPWAGTGRVHKGFAAMLAGKWRDIQAAIDMYQGMRMLYTGHSLGAAGAQEASYSILMLNNDFAAKSDAPVCSGVNSIPATASTEPGSVAWQDRSGATKVCITNGGTAPPR